MTRVIDEITFELSEKKVEIFIATNVSSLASLQSQTVEKWPKPNFWRTTYLSINISPIYTGW